MIKTFIACAAAIILFPPLYAQNDSIPPAIADTVEVMTDTLVVDTIPVVRYNATDIGAPKPSVYKIKPAIDLPLFAVNAAWSLYALGEIYHKPVSNEEDVLNLNKNDINGFDRWAVRPYSPHLDKISYLPFQASMPLPLVFLLCKNTRKDFFKLTFLYLEAMSITGVLYTASTYFVDRYRPYVYSSGTEISQRINGGGKNSFYAGHPALVATSLFFGAKVFSDYYPDSKIKWLLYTAAASITAYTAYVRLRGGMHFPSDLLLGVTQGALTGILVPHFHRHKIIKDPNLSLLPYTNGFNHGLALVYKLK